MTRRPIPASLRHWPVPVQTFRCVRIGDLPDSSLKAVKVGMVRRVVCASPHYLETHGIPATPEALTDHSCITFEVPSSVGAWGLGAGKSQQTVPVRSRLSVNTAKAAITAATLGVGVIRVLSYQVADAVQRGDLQVVLQPHESAALPISLVHKGQAPLPLKVRAFLEFVTPRLREENGAT